MPEVYVASDIHSTRPRWPTVFSCAVFPPGWLGEMAFALSGQSAFGDPIVSVPDGDEQRAYVLIGESERLNDQPTWPCPRCEQRNAPRLELY
jgi:hypothetical protein